MLQKILFGPFQGDAIIITTIEGKENDNLVDWAKFNEGQPIKYLISAPTMRVPMDVANTANAYLAFRAIILAGIYGYKMKLDQQKQQQEMVLQTLPINV